MREHSSEDGLNQDKATANGKGTTTPSRELQVALGDNRVEICNAQFLGGEREAKIGLGEGGDGAPEGGGNRGSNGVLGMDRAESALVEINGKTRGSGKTVEDPFLLSYMLRDCPDDDKSVIGILENGARKIIHKGVKDKTVP
jgi:hypothetical protein